MSIENKKILPRLFKPSSDFIQNIKAQPDFEKHTRGYLLHNTKPIEAMTEEQAIEYLIQKDIPQRVWRTWDEGNKPKMVICRTHQLPEHRQWRNAWQITNDIELVA